jgi:hypothetical protein
LVKNRNFLIENVTISKDMNGITNYLMDQQKSEKIVTPDSSSGQTQMNIVSIDLNKKPNENCLNIPDSNQNLNLNLEKTRKDFSGLLILMRKATRLINVFDNKVKVVANKLS